MYSRLATTREHIQAIPPEVLFNEMEPRLAVEMSRRWAYQARPEQVAPQGNWTIWSVRAGRGFGKTRAAAEWVIDRIASGCRRGIIIGPTHDAVKFDMVEGESGLIECSHGAIRWGRKGRELIHRNGAIIRCISAEKPRGLRGPNNQFAWCDEPYYYQDLEEIWKALTPSMRLPVLGDKPRTVFTGTPQSLDIVEEIEARSDCVVTTGSSYDNLENLAGSFKDSVLKFWEGTTLERQEIYGEIMDASERALWTRDMIMRVEEAPETLDEVAVGVDPSGGRGEIGIVAAGRSGQDAYILGDLTVKGCRPPVWAACVDAAVQYYKADVVVAETNFGGDMVPDALENAGIDVPVEVVTASRGKAPRAAPVSVLYQRKRVKHVGEHPELEKQMVTWEPGDKRSPDRMDAMVWAITYLNHGYEFNALGLTDDRDAASESADHGVW